MARAMALGWATAGEGPDQMLFTDAGSGRSRELAAEVGGEAVEGNAELAERSDLLVLAVKPAALDDVAGEAGRAQAVLSLLGATPVARIAAAFPEADAYRAMPTVAAEVHRGVICFAAAEGASGERGEAIRGLLGLLGRVVELDDAQLDPATAVMGCSPAYIALVLEAIADAGAEEGLDRDLSRSLVVESAAGTVELLRSRDPAEVRRAVASPGGSTEAGLEALERQGAARAFERAVRASLARMRG